MLKLHKNEPLVCGGTDESVDENAPKKIQSKEMILFDVTSVLPPPDPAQETDPLGFVSAFAAPTDEGTFLFFETGRVPFMHAEKRRTWALVTETVFPSLTALVREQNLAADNGSYSYTHGLPENFGGSVTVKYASGESILFSSNQHPILSRQTGERIAALFIEAMNGEKVALPEPDTLKAMRFDEECEDGSFTHSVLTVNEDGSGTLIRLRRFSDPQVYESERTVEAEALSTMKRTIADCGLLAWASLPESSYPLSGDKTLTFAFADGSEISVPADRILPEQIRDGFFRVELEMTRG